MGNKFINEMQKENPQILAFPEGRFIEGRRLYLRGLEEKDINPRYVAWLNDQQVNFFMATRRYPTTINRLRSYYEKIQGDSHGIYLAICLKEKDRHIGNVKLDRIDWISRTCEFGLLIGESQFWGQGLGAEATYLITQHGFFQLNLHRITIYSIADNERALRCYAKAGYQQEGIIRKAVFMNGDYRDVVVMGQLREEFRRRSEYEPEEDLHHR